MGNNSTEYFSTRGNADILDFAGVTLTGLAGDGGLYVPTHWPRFTPEQISAFMSWGPSNGLTDIYGDPQRGFAGGYIR